MRGHSLPGWVAACMGLIVNDLRHWRRSGFRGLLWLCFACCAVTQSHRDAVIRHRRAMLELNTAVGLRLLP